MSNILTYPALRCVLEYMEANKRIHTTFRCPSLRIFEKSIPLRLDILSFSETYLDLNRVNYTIMSAIEQIVDEDNVDSGDLVTMPPLLRENTFYSINFENKNRKQMRRVPDGLNMRRATRKLIEIMLGGRKTIIVNGLCNNCFRVLRLPIGLTKIRVNELYSLPVESSSNHADLFKDCKKYCGSHRQRIDYFWKLWCAREQISGLHSNLSHKNVIINDYETPEDIYVSTIFGIINAWITREQEIGTRYKFECNVRVRVQDYYMLLENQFKGRGAEQRLIDNIRYLTIPINATSEIVFREVMRTIPIRQQDDEIFLYLEMEVIPFQSVATTEKETGFGSTILFANFPVVPTNVKVEILLKMLIFFFIALLLVVLICVILILFSVVTRDSQEL